MRTKIVYVLVCSREDSFYEQFLLSLRSLTLHNPGCSVEVLLDPVSYDYVREKDEPLLEGVALRKVEVPDSGRGGVYVSRWIKTSLRSIVEGDFLYLDCDTVIARSLSDIDDMEGDMAAVINGNGQASILERGDRYLLDKAGMTGLGDGPYYNGGVFLVRDTEPARRFFDTWHSTWLEQCKAGGPLYDQTSLFKTNLGMGCMIKELPGEWNVQIWWDAAAHYFPYARVIHPYASTHIFENSVVVPHIKENGDRLDDFAMEIARDPLSGGINLYRSKSFKGKFLKPYADLLYRLRKRPRLFLWTTYTVDDLARLFALLLQKTGKNNR